ncbi:MAG: 4'-phosphopantetheinyl transferase family protein [Mucilaginibacter sp.]|jgi:phosphopantetheinyl transferase (holo-ACP synthase)
MSSTGNDIVALKAINVARTKQSNFYSKIITPREEEYYDLHLRGSLSLEIFVWVAWSAKESAYKFLKRHQPELIFSPSKINITHLEIGKQPDISEEREGQGFENFPVRKGRMTSVNIEFCFRSILTDDYIFTVVNRGDDFQNICWGIKKIASNTPDDQSREVRNFLLQRLNKLFPGNDLRIEKSEIGYPVIISNGTELPIPVSFAHHDDYIGYSFVLNN